MSLAENDATRHDDRYGRPSNPHTCECVSDSGPCDCLGCDPLGDTPRDRLATAIRSHLRERWSYIDINTDEHYDQEWRDLCRDAADAVMDVIAKS